MVQKISGAVSPIEEAEKINEIIDDKQDNLVSGVNIKTINGNSLVGSGNVTVTGQVTVDYITVNYNNNSEVQAIGVMNNNAASPNALKTWTGTKVQYDAIVTKDSNTLYHITDDANISVTLLETIYPVGSIYIGTMNSCPLAALFGTWTLVGSGKVLQGADGNHSAGTTIAAGLPDHTHHIGIYDANGSSGGGGYIPANSYNAGAVIVNSGFDGESGNGNWTDRGATSYCTSRNQLDNASASNSIYGNSNTVQPPAFVVNIWQRTA